jgi:hypothetical protein
MARQSRVGPPPATGHRAKGNPETVLERVESKNGVRGGGVPKWANTEILVSAASTRYRLSSSCH